MKRFNHKNSSFPQKLPFQRKLNTKPSDNHPSRDLTFCPSFLSFAFILICFDINSLRNEIYIGLVLVISGHGTAVRTKGNYKLLTKNVKNLNYIALLPFSGAIPISIISHLNASSITEEGNLTVEKSH